MVPRRECIKHGFILSYAMISMLRVCSILVFTDNVGVPVQRDVLWPGPTAPAYRIGYPYAYPYEPYSYLRTNPYYYGYVEPYGHVIAKRGCNTLLCIDKAFQESKKRRKG